MTVRHRATVYLRVYRDFIARLKSIPKGDTDDEVIERMALHAEWDNVAGRVARLDEMVRAGLLEPDQVDEFGEIARELTALLPVLREHGYRLPDLDALARAAARPAAAPTT